MRKIIADEITALGGQAPHAVVDAEDAFDWTDGKKGPRIGSYYTVLRGFDLEKVRVLVRDAAPAIPPTVFQNLHMGQFPRINFENLTATISVNSRTGGLAIYAEAKAAKLVQPQR